MRREENRDCATATVFRQALLIAIGLPATAVAQTASDCARISNDLDRLACYDKASGRTPKLESVNVESAWRVEVETSKMTESKDVYLTTSSVDRVTCRSRQQQVGLVLRCKEGKTSLFIPADGCHMASSEYHSWGHVTYRIDAEKATTVRMNASTDHSSLGLWSGESAIPVIKKLFGKSTLLIRMTPYSESPVTATFNVIGLENAIQPLRQSCKS
jgi:type VI secretion system protein VasI